MALDTTFTAWASVSDPLQETISGGPPALDAATRELPRQRPLRCASSEELFRRFRPAFANLSRCRARPGSRLPGRHAGAASARPRSTGA